MLSQLLVRVHRHQVDIHQALVTILISCFLDPTSHLSSKSVARTTRSENVLHEIKKIVLRDSRFSQ